MSPGTLDALILIGAIVVVSFLAFIWITFFRKGGRRRRHKRKDSKTYTKQLQEQLGDTKSVVKKDRRRNIGNQFPQNPTLAQTGGLPPAREERKSDSPTSP